VFQRRDSRGYLKETWNRNTSKRKPLEISRVPVFVVFAFLRQKLESRLHPGFRAEPLELPQRQWRREPFGKMGVPGVIRPKFQ
jgi:hypothetical protein